MSGTSMDGIDAVVADVTIKRGGAAVSVNCLAAYTRPYRARLRSRMMELAAGKAVAAAEIAKLDIELGSAFAGASTAVLERARVSAGEVDAVASHGQTIVHGRYGAAGRGATVTMQLGQASTIAERTGLTVVSDFRQADIAAGGEGAPLVPFVHALLFSHRRRRRGVQNIGGMGNLTLLAPGGAIESVRGTDTGPGGVLIDAAMKWVSGGRLRMDRGGKFAAGGRVDERLVKAVLARPFFKRPLPRSAGPADFGPRMARDLARRGRRLRLDDRSIIASLTMATARSIARACGNDLDELYLCGGGAFNATLSGMIAGLLPGVQVGTTGQLGMDPAYVEAQAFAVLGYLALNGVAANLPAATAARGPRVLGKITPGANFARASLALG